MLKTLETAIVQKYIFYLLVIELAHVEEESALHSSRWSGSSILILSPNFDRSNPILSISTGYCFKLVSGTGVSSPVVFSVSGPLKYQAKLNN